MTVSGITGVVRSDFVKDTGAFVRQNYTWVVWSVPATIDSTQLLRWKKHDGTEFSYVQANLQTRFWNFACIYRPANDSLVVFYDTDSGPNDTGSQVYCVSFNLLTGAIINSPQAIATGFKPSVVYRNNSPGDDIILSYANRVKGSVYCRQSIDGGNFWTAERPILSNKVRSTTDVVAVSHDSTHLSVLQVGEDARPLAEIGAWNHSRPLAVIVKHPSVADRYLVAEPNQRVIATVNQLSENTHGALALDPSGTAIYQGFGDRLGTDDSINALIYLNTSGTNPTLVSSVFLPTGANVAGEVARATISGTPGYDQRFEIFTGGQIVQDIATSSTCAYVAGGSDVGVNLGALVVMRLSDYATATVLSGISSVRAVCTATSGGTTYLFAGTNSGGQEYIKIYLENGLSPSNAGYLDHKMPARITRVLASLTSPTSGTLYVCMVDRLHVYQFNGPTNPLQLFNNIPVLTIGSFYHAVLAANGNLVCAKGASGAAVIGTDGGTVAQIKPTGVSAAPWSHLTVVPTGAFMRPTSKNPYAPQETYFKATVGGTTGVVEPKWVTAPTTISDNGATWLEQNPVTGIVTSVAVDQTQKRIYAAGVIGGVNGVSGRVWVFDASGGII